MFSQNTTHDTLVILFKELSNGQVPTDHGSFTLYYSHVKFTQSKSKTNSMFFFSIRQHHHCIPAKTPAIVMVQLQLLDKSIQKAMQA